MDRKVLCVDKNFLKIYGLKGVRVRPDGPSPFSQFGPMDQTGEPITFRGNKNIKKFRQRFFFGQKFRQRSKEFVLSL